MTSFTTPVQLRWTDLDAQGHVNNVTVADYMQQARAQFQFDALTPAAPVRVDRGGQEAGQKLGADFVLQFGVEPGQVGPQPAVQETLVDTDVEAGRFFRLQARVRHK